MNSNLTGKHKPFQIIWKRARVLSVKSFQKTPSSKSGSITSGTLNFLIFLKNYAVQYCNLILKNTFRFCAFSTNKPWQFQTAISEVIYSTIFVCVYPFWSQGKNECLSPIGKQNIPIRHDHLMLNNTLPELNRSESRTRFDSKNCSVTTM